MGFDLANIAGAHVSVRYCAHARNHFQCQKVAPHFKHDLTYCFLALVKRHRGIQVGVTNMYTFTSRKVFSKTKTAIDDTLSRHKKDCLSSKKNVVCHRGRLFCPMQCFGPSINYVKPKWGRGCKLLCKGVINIKHGHVFWIYGPFVFFCHVLDWLHTLYVAKKADLLYQKSVTMFI